MAAGDLTTLAVVKGYLPGLDPVDTQFDDLLARLISAVSAQFTGEVGRDLSSASATEVYDGHGGKRLTPNRWPITAVSSLTVDGEAIAARASVTGTGYVIDNGTSIVLAGYRFTEGTQNVSLTYTAGYTTMPSDVEQAVVKMVALQFKDKDRIGQGSRSVSGESVSYADAPVLAYWRSVVDAYTAPNAP